MDTTHIRNFSIIAHIDHGKSTLADRLLEITGTIEKRKMRAQVLDSMELERERGITIKMQPVRMIYKVNHTDRGNNADGMPTHAEGELLYEDLTYKLRGIFFEVRKKIGLGHKEQIYHNALEIEFTKAGLKFESRKNISLIYEGKSIGLYQPDFVLEDRVLVELKTLPEIGRPQTEQVWSYLKGCSYKLALLVNFGSRDLEIKRIVYDTAREADSASSAFRQRSSAGVSDQVENSTYVLNLIDTPGHIDFSYEVSRAQKAVEGAVLLVDATQGVQAQTLTTLQMARDAGLVIIPVVNKIDSPLAQIPETIHQIAQILGCDESEVLKVSGKTGEGVEYLISEIIRRIPPPTAESRGEFFRSLVFDFQYLSHRGIVVYVRVFAGSVKKGDELLFKVANQKFTALEVGIFSPDETPVESLSAGETGYIVTGLKEAGIASVGDTVASLRDSAPPLPGYREPKPVVWASVYPESQDDFTLLRQALSRLKLSDAAFSFEEESSGLLGRGFRCGFLGVLHLEIITERLRREFNLQLVVTLPSINYRIIRTRGAEEIIYTPSKFPEDGDIKEVFEPWVTVCLITPPDYVGKIIPLLFNHEATVLSTDNLGESKTALTIEMPLRELMRGFFDEIKSATSGYASLSYEIGKLRSADVVRLDILVADELVPAFARVVSRRRVEEEAKAMVEKLYTILPRQLFAAKIQARAMGRIISSRTLSALRKDVTGYLYGGDISRKKKLWEKQKEGKKRLKEHARVTIPHDVFLKMMRSGE